MPNQDEDRRLSHLLADVFATEGDDASAGQLGDTGTTDARGIAGARLGAERSGQSGALAPLSADLGDVRVAQIESRIRAGRAATASEFRKALGRKRRWDWLPWRRRLPRS
jgi:hypothetical protein